jgi:hypothetical protein
MGPKQLKINGYFDSRLDGLFVSYFNSFLLVTCLDVWLISISLIAWVFSLLIALLYYLVSRRFLDSVLVLWLYDQSINWRVI